MDKMLRVEQAIQRIRNAHNLGDLAREWNRSAAERRGSDVDVRLEALEACMTAIISICHAGEKK
jgi:hypothetical protein